MAKTIYKYRIRFEEDQIIKMPENSTILCLQIQKGFPFIWVQVEDSENELIERRFIIYETGATMWINVEEVIEPGLAVLEKQTVRRWVCEECERVGTESGRIGNRVG